MDVQPEEASYHGRADLVVKTRDQIFVVEFKIVGHLDAASALTTAMEQMQNRGYADKYRESGKTVHLIGIVGSREAKSLLEIRAELA